MVRERLSSNKSRHELDDDCTTKLLNRVPLAKAGGILYLQPCDRERFKLEWSEFMAYGALAQLARAPALQAGGPGFESLTLHHS